MARVRRNLDRLATYAAEHGLGVRPHTKTHKSQALAKAQLDAGAVGLTVAKVGEALVMAEVGDDLLLAYPAVDAARTRRIAELARERTVRVAVDTPEAVDALDAAARQAGSVLGMLADLDLGMHRTGVQSPEAAAELAQRIERAKGLRLDGLFCYPGHIWGAAADQGPALAPGAEQLARAVELFKRHGLSTGIVSGGSTPTAYQSHLAGPLTEIRPGTYIFNDMNTVHGGFCSLEDCAATLVCTVVSDAVPGQVVIDAGSKTLTSDRCVPNLDSGHGYVLEYPDARITKLSEEHGQVDVSACDARPRVGERVTVIPNHICPCVNLQDNVWWDEGDGQLVPHRVDARGKLS